MTDNTSEHAFQTCLRGLRERALALQIRPEIFDRAMRSVALRPDVLAKQSQQAEFSLTIREYLERTVSDDRVRKGRNHLRQHRALLNRIEADYKVEAEVITAIWGLETDFGGICGSFPVLGALATLACQGRRAGFFETELISALRIIQNGDIAAENMLGSWAGAMGHGQFMPTSFLDFAVDYDGDGRRDIWGDDPTDALASIANYLTKHGWIKGQPWGLEVSLPKGFDYAASGTAQSRPVKGWAELDVRRVDGEEIGAYGPASILLPAGAGGASFMVFRNFHVILRYNQAESYALAIGHLADRIGGGKGFVAGWPDDDRALDRDEIREMQLLLNKAGYDTVGVDGFMGPNTIAAIRTCQQGWGTTADGFPGAEVLQRLRREAG